ncbi:hypothetical protein GGI12_001593 [Dipsacomyces acuminosporus]|nr:hypothetical protein GGI12_001593 [Dipsacomyces acuminosporus]
MAEKRKSQQKDASTKKAKTQKPSKRDSKSKSKSKSSAQAQGLSEAVRSSIPYPKQISGSGFTETTAKFTVTLAPIYSRDVWAGVHEALNGMLLHFVPQVRGVVLSYSKAKLLSNTALLFNDSPYGQLEVSARLLLWRPIAGMTVNGRINVQSPDHIGLLLWDTFNASIPASFIPKDKYEWRPFDDDEIVARAAAVRQGNPAASEHKEDGDDGDDGKNGEEEKSADESGAEDQSANKSPDFISNKFGSGEWVLKGSSQPIGTEGCLDLVVVDVIRANEVLSVTGALR